MEAPLHPKTKESHAYNVAWNEYVIENLGLRIEKRKGLDYRSITVYAGSFKIYDAYDAHVNSTINARMHRQLRRFLEDYLAYFLKNPQVPFNDKFNPPVSGSGLVLKK